MSDTITNFEYKPPTVVAIFLVNFDMKEGYKIVWSQAAAGYKIDFDGLEYKCLPSGLHNVLEDSILLAHNTPDHGLLYGVAKYLQNSAEQEAAATKNTNTNIGTGSGSSSGDRLLVKMYSLGILCCELEPSVWKPNKFICNGWEYLDILGTSLRGFMEAKEYGNFVGFSDVFESLQLKRKLKQAGHLRIENHPISQLSELFQTLGPLVFVVAKQALLRKKILFLHQNGSKISNFESGAFVYLTSLLSLTPHDLNLLDDLNDDLNYSTPIYNVVLHDLADKNSLVDSLSLIIGCTNDSILLYQKQAYDVAICLPSDDSPHTFVVKRTKFLSSGPDSGRNVILENAPREKATLKDYHKFRLIYKEFYDRYKKDISGGIKSETASIVSRLSTSSAFTAKFAVSENGDFPKSGVDELKLDSLVPLWWLSEATSPMSWREYIWSAFSWFATAGSVSNSDIADELEEQRGREPHHSGESLGLQLPLPQQSLSVPGQKPSELNEFVTASEVEDIKLKRQFRDSVEIIGFFHKLFRKWFYLINEIVVEQLEDQSASIDHDGSRTRFLDKKILIELTYQDIVDMELDPYSNDDLEFVKEFVLLYWSSYVDEVGIGLGISNICC